MKHGIILYFLAFLTLFVAPGISQEPDQDASQFEAKFEQIKTERLKRIRGELVQLQNNINLAKKKVARESDLVNKLKIESELEELQKEFNAKNFLFIETATNISLQAKEAKPKDRDLSRDIRDIVDPLLDAIKGISERPRAIQELKEKSEYLSERLEATKAAEKKLNKFLKENPDPELNKAIQRSIETVEDVSSRLEIELEDSQFRLLKLEQSDGGSLSTFSFAVFDFFKTKGKNLLLAMLVFIGLYWLLGTAQDRFVSLFMIRVGKAAEQPSQTHWMKRPLKVLYGLFAFITALFMSVLTLYILNDWVLVTFIIFLLVGLVWSSRSFVPQYFELVKVLLNFGPVREGERLVYQGLPWKVKTLGYYCRLVNPALSGGSIRVNTKELMSLHSRPVGDAEAWFPSRNDDWVSLSDGSFGKVLMQSPEFVNLKLIGDQVKYIPTLSYLDLNPINLSNGFGIDVTFGVDYNHQALVLDEVISNFKTHVYGMLTEEFKADKEDFQAFTIEFREAGASSLDLRVFLKCAGRMASRKLILERRIKAYLVDACNKFGYVIPFQQITVHQAGGDN